MYSVIATEKNIKQIEDCLENISYKRIGDFGNEEIKVIIHEIVRVNTTDALIIDIDSCYNEGLISALRQYRTIRSKTRIIIIAPGKAPGDLVISSIVKLGIYDIISPPVKDQEETLLIPYIIEAINKERAGYSEAARWDVDSEVIETSKKPKVKEVEKVVERIVEKPVVIEKEVEREVKVEVVNNATIAVISNASTGKSFVSWNIAHCFSERGYKTSVINLDRGYSANIFYGIDNEFDGAIKNISKQKKIINIFDKAYTVNENLRIITNNLCSKEEMNNEQFLKVLNIVQANSDITIIDCKSEANDILKTAIAYSSTILFIFDIDNMHYKLNLEMLKEVENELNPRKTIVVINNVFFESNEFKNTQKFIKQLEKSFRDIVSIRNGGAAVYDAIGTNSCAYFETDDKEFKRDMDKLMDAMKAKEKQKSFFEKIFRK